MSQLATDVGFSNAPSLIATKPVIMRNTYIGRSEDLPATVMLGPSQNQGLAVSSRLANSHLNSMLIGRFAGRMSLIETIRITSSTAVSTVLFNFPLNPTAMFYADYGLKDVANTFYPHPAHYIARLFRVWRGSFKFHFPE